jgi:hypothetical protein
MKFAPPIGVGLLAFALALALARCGDDDSSPSSPAPTIAAPVHVSPASGSFVDSQPTLTIQNVTPSDGSTPTYHFQVALSNGFSPVAAEQTGVAQGSGGQTSWRVNVPMPAGTYFWHARAQVGSASGAFSENDRFTATTGIAGGTLFIQDLLTNGTSVGSVRGGEFTPDGWRINNLDEYIRYEIPPTSNGFVEWENVGLQRTNGPGRSEWRRREAHGFRSVSGLIHPRDSAASRILRVSTDSQKRERGSTSAGGKALAATPSR